MNKSRNLAGALMCVTALSLHAQEEIDFTPPGQIVPVADEGPEDLMEVAVNDFSVPEPTEEDLLSQEFGLYVQLMRDNVYDEADTVAKRVVELAMRLKGRESNEAAKALTNLAIVQHQTGQFDAAAQNFQSSIEIIEEIEDRLHSQLINPLKGLGASQLEIGRADLAIGTFQRAVHVTHVNEGPHNLEQIEILESVAETNLRVADFDAAKAAQDVIYSLNVREHGPDTLELIPSLMRRAVWQHRAGFIYNERTTYRRIIRIIERRAGKADLRLVDPLIRLGKSYFFIDTSGTESMNESNMVSGEIHFRRAVKVALENPEPDWQVTAQASLSLADFYMFEGKLQRARQTYGAAWALLTEDESRLDVRREQLEIAVPIIEQQLPRYVDSDEPLDDDSQMLQGQIAVTYKISVRGRVANLKMVEATPPEFTNMQRYVQRELRRRIYRPIFQDGLAVVSPDQMLVHNFFYRQVDLDAIRAAADPASTDADE